MTRRVFLGVDCGTQSTKAVLVDESGAALAIGRAPHRLISAADGTSEQQPTWWRSAMTTAVRRVLASAESVEVAGIAVSGQQHGLVCLDERDGPVRPAKLWNDTSAAAAGDRLSNQLGGRDRVLALTGNLMLAGYTAPKLAWLREHDPDSYRRSRRFCLPHDYLNLLLTGTFVTEPGDASGTAYVDVVHRRYSEPVLAAIDPDRDWESSLPVIRPSLSEIGTLTAKMADSLGLRSGIPVSAGAGDNMAAAIGVGAISEGPVVVSLGTSGTAFAHRDLPAIDPDGEAAAFCGSTGGWLPLVCTLNCTLATEWIRRLFRLSRPAFEAMLTATRPGANGLSFLPHLAGERTPDQPHGTGLFSGLRAPHDRADLVRAVVEGVTFGLEYALRALQRAGVRPAEITLVGGGARSDGWAQLCADIFGLPVVRSPVDEAAAVGAALQARWVIDGELPPKVPGGDRFDPRAAPKLAIARERLDRLRRSESRG